jgi:hypothetical protein
MNVRKTNSENATHRLHSHSYRPVSSLTATIKITYRGPRIGEQGSLKSEKVRRFDLYVTPALADILATGLLAVLARGPSDFVAGGEGWWWWRIALFQA